MPIHLKHDYRGHYYQYGNTGHKYYFHNYLTQKQAYLACLQQVKAIHVNRSK